MSGDTSDKGTDMADPTKYKPHFNYSGWEAAGNKRPKPGAELDIDFANIARSVDETIDALKDIRRSDGKLKNGIVDMDAMEPGLKAEFQSYKDDAETARDQAQQARSGAESAQGAAETARDIAKGYASDAVSQGNVPIYASAATVQGLDIPAGITAFRTNGETTPGDGKGSLYVESDASSGTLQSGDGRWWAEAAVRDHGTFSTVADVENSHIPPVLESITVSGIRYEREGSEPSHNSKVQSADGSWWVPIVPFGYAFDSVSDMQASRLVTPGARVRTLGYYTPGDGGGNDYEIVAAGTGTDDGGSFIDLSGSGLQARGLFDGSTVSVKKFGAKGDDSTDNYAAFQACFDYVAGQVGLGAGDSYNSQKIHIPSGTYRLSQKAIYQVAVSGVPSSGTPGASIYGDGPQNTYLVASPSNNTGLIECTSDKNSEIFRVKGIGFLSDLDEDAATNNGIALEINSTLKNQEPGFGSHPRRSAHVSNCYFGGYGGSIIERFERGNFETSIRIAYKWYPVVRDCWVRGTRRPFDTTTNEPLYTLTGRTYGIHFKGCYSPEVGDTYLNGYYLHGICVEGRDDFSDESVTDFEDFRLYDSFIVGQDKGFSVIHSEDQSGKTLFEPGGSITNCHINSDSAGVHLKYHRQVIISGVYFYVPRGRGLPNYSGLPSAIWLDGADDIIVNSCEFLEPGFYTDDNNSSVAIKCTNRVNAKVSSCLFNHGGVGVHSAGSSGGKITVENATVGGQQIPAWAPFKRYVDDNINVLHWSELITEPLYDIQRTVSRKGGSSETLRYAHVAEREDYATNHNPSLVRESALGLNSSGDEVSVTVITHEYLDNTAGSEDGQYSIYVRSGGALAKALAINGDARIVGIVGFSSGGKDGVSGSFTAQSGETITVTNGIVTGIE